jgi:hypothetical protein
VTVMPENRQSSPEEVAAGMAPVTARPRRRERLDPPCAEAPGCANGYHGRPCLYAITPIPPDPDRDARVAARRAEDARRAGRALDGLLSDSGKVLWGGGYDQGWRDGYRASQVHHNRHYAVPDDQGAWDGDGDQGGAS